MNRPEDMKGLEGMLAFLNYLRTKRIKFGVEQQRDDSLMVSFTMYGYRVEVDFFVDHIEFSYFTGNEDVESDERLLFDLIDKNWRES